MFDWLILTLVGITLFVLGLVFGYHGLKGGLEEDGYYILIHHERKAGNGRYSIHTLNKLEAKNGTGNSRDKNA